MIKREMQKFIHISLIVILLTVFVTGVGCDGTDTTKDSKSPESVVEHGCEWSETLPESRPSDFNLIFKYGYGSINKNVLNTFNGTYTWDMVVDPPITIDFSLSDEDMDSIYQKMVEIDFFCYPDEFKIPLPENGIVTISTPYNGYYFRVECNSRVKELRWDDEIRNKNEDAGILRTLIRLIRDIIESKEEYKNLPPPRGAYL
jgi:hypothetical protein